MRRLVKSATDQGKEDRNGRKGEGKACAGLTGESSLSIVRLCSRPSFSSELSLCLHNASHDCLRSFA